jgi:hypothetical protein
MEEGLRAVQNIAHGFGSASEWLMAIRQHFRIHRNECQDSLKDFPAGTHCLPLDTPRLHLAKEDA